VAVIAVAIFGNGAGYLLGTTPSRRYPADATNALLQILGGLILVTLAIWAGRAIWLRVAAGEVKLLAIGVAGLAIGLAGGFVGGVAVEQSAKPVPASYSASQRATPPGPAPPATAITASPATITRPLAPIARTIPTPQPTLIPVDETARLAALDAASRADYAASSRNLSLFAASSLRDAHAAAVRAIAAMDGSNDPRASKARIAVQRLAAALDAKDWDAEARLSGELRAYRY
jgi:hypothetical protein